MIKITICELNPKASQALDGKSPFPSEELIWKLVWIPILVHFISILETVIDSHLNK